MFRGFSLAVPILFSLHNPCWAMVSSATVASASPHSLLTAFWKSLNACHWSLKGAKGSPHKIFQSHCKHLSLENFDGLKETEPLEDVFLKVQIRPPKNQWQEILQKVEIQDFKILHQGTLLNARGTLMVEEGGWIRGSLTLKGKKMLSGLAKWLPEGVLSPAARLVLQAVTPLLESPQVESLSQKIQVHFRERKVFINDLQICPQRPLKISEGKSAEGM